nr:hypothetical protein [Mesorhizobium sp. J428]
MSRTDDRATAKAAAGSEFPAMIAPTSTTLAGSAQITVTMNTAS